MRTFQSEFIEQFIRVVGVRTVGCLQEEATGNFHNAEKPITTMMPDITVNERVGNQNLNILYNGENNVEAVGEIVPLQCGVEGFD